MCVWFFLFYERVDSSIIVLHPEKFYFLIEFCLTKIKGLLIGLVIREFRHFISQPALRYSAGKINMKFRANYCYFGHGPAL